MNQQSQIRRRRKKTNSIIGSIVISIIALMYIGLGVAGVILKVTGGYSQDAGETVTVTGTPAVALGVVYIIFGMFILAAVIAAYVGSKRKPRSCKDVARENEQDAEDTRNEEVTGGDKNKTDSKAGKGKKD